MGSGRFDGDLEGWITFNRQPGTRAMKRLIAYVTQDDVLPPVLTVHEMLMFHTRLRSNESLQTSQDRVDRTILQLGLTHCKHTPVTPRNGDRGVSGGERKRAAIACEMLAEPRVLFLDEPTSGLDSYTAGQLLKLLQQLAREGQAIACSIHQPSSELMSRFDKLMLLTHGEVVYFGTNSDAVGYMSSQGYELPGLWNPADWYLKLLSDANSDESCHPRTQGEPDDGLNEVQKKLIDEWRHQG